MVRHAQTMWNKEQRYAGSAEVPLAPESADQIAELTEQFRRRPLVAVYSSPLSRCQLTVAGVAESHCLVINLKKELKERNIGDWEGKSSSELALHHAGYHFPDSAYNGQFHINNAEPLADLEARVRKVLQEIGDRHEGLPVLVATHAGIIWAVQKYIVSNPPETIMWPGNCSVHELDYHNRHFELVS